MKENERKIMSDFVEQLKEFEQLTLGEKFERICLCKKIISKHSNKYTQIHQELFERGLTDSNPSNDSSIILK